VPAVRHGEPKSKLFDTLVPVRPRGNGPTTSGNECRKFATVSVGLSG
jgi:hypothetical protein